MNREEAKFILGAYRANGEDAHDPQFQEALALVKEDPELARWFAQEQAMDTAIANKIRDLPAPANLKAELLAARKTIPVRPWWRRRAWLAAAASVALLVSASGMLLMRKGDTTGLAAFRRAMVAASLDMTHHLDVTGLDAAGLKQWLAEHNGNSDFVLPAGLAGKQAGGCKVLDWSGHKVTLLCFMFDGKHADVFVVDTADLPGLGLGGDPRFAQEGGITTAAWRHEGKVYLLAGNISGADLTALF